MRKEDTKKIAITGSIASGKTYTSSIIEAQGFDVFYSDKFINSLYEQTEFIAQLKTLFPDLTSITKSQIAQKIFNDEKARKNLELLIHPILIKELERYFLEKANQGKKIIFAEVPLLFEASLENMFDYIILVICDPEVRRQRALKRENMTLELFEKILKTQMPDIIKSERSDFILHSTYNELELKIHIENLLNELEKIR